MDKTKLDEILYPSLRAVYHFERALCSKSGLDYQEIYLLQILRENGSLRVGDIAEQLDIPVFQATRLVQHMEETAFVQKMRREDDRRSVWVSLTRKGSNALKKLEEKNYDQLKDSLDHLTDAQFDAFRTVVKELPAFFGVEGLLRREKA